MKTYSETSTFALLANEPGYDLLEDRIRLNTRATIGAVFEEELQSFLARCRYGCGGEGAKGHRNGHRERQIIGTFGADTVAMLLWALLASGQIYMRKVDGWETLSQPIEPATLDRAA